MPSQGWKAQSTGLGEDLALRLPPSTPNPWAGPMSHFPLSEEVDPFLSWVAT